MIDVARDAEGVRMALEALFEEEFVRARIEREGRDEATRERMECQVPGRELSPGYYRWGEHLLRLDAERQAGVALDAGRLSALECDGMVALERARGKFRYDHPACSGCGTQQESRFSPKCGGCGVEFRKKGG